MSAGQRDGADQDGADDEATLAGSGSAREPNAASGASALPYRGGGFRALGVAVSRVAAPVIQKRGGALVRLKAEWAAIVGTEWAALTWPTSLGRDGALKLRVAPAAALDLQHRAPLLLQRINLYCGRAIATRLVLLQGPLPLMAAPPRPKPGGLPPARQKALEDSVAAVTDPELREALLRLGGSVLSEGCDS
ncbi:MAG: DUF721 domain-containing protein [Alphaproteobacteria bacterium]|nr:DUF721 domain-containing protein [Alphaproteobacteria bacterium]